MFRYLISTGLGAFVLCCSVWGTDKGQQVTTIRDLTSMPLAFTENQGQWDDRVMFRADASGATMWFTADGVYHQFTRRVPRAEAVSAARFDALLERPDRELDSVETMVIKTSFVGANPSPRVTGQELMEYKCNYFIGNDPSKWRTDVANYQEIAYELVYPGIDLKYYGNGQQMEYDFIVAPGAEPSRIVVRYEGVNSVAVNDAGELVVETDWGQVIEQRPVVYQLVNGDRLKVAGRYTLKDDMSFGFRLPDGYDTGLPLVIDPTLVYSTYLGGSDYDWSLGMAVDASGCAYVTGVTYSTDFPTVNPYQGNFDYAGETFVTKLSSAGNSLVYSTYLGGDWSDWGAGIAVDASGCAYVTGMTGSSDFPTVNPYQTHQNGDDVFVTKLSSAGNSLIYSTYLGGSHNDEGRGIAIDTSGCAYVTGVTQSTDFPTVNPYQTDQGGRDVFVAKLVSAGNGLIYSTYLGGSGNDEYVDGIAVDISGCAYVTGRTSSADFPTVNPYQTFQGYYDAFVSKLSSAGNSLHFSTFLGGDNGDFGYAIAVDASGCAYVTGTTSSTDFPTADPYQTFQGVHDVYVTKLSSGGNSLVYSTYLGGSADDRGLGLAIDASGCAYVTGYTESTDFPTVDPYQTQPIGRDVFVTKLTSAGNNLLYSTYLGGNTNDEYGSGIAVDASGCAYVTGRTHSSDFPTVNPYQTHQGWTDAFVTKLAAESCCNHDGERGDVNYDLHGPNIVDITHLVAYLFGTGDPPPCDEEGDVNGDGNVNIVDLTLLVAYLFGAGDPPEPCP